MSVATATKSAVKGQELFLSGNGDNHMSVRPVALSTKKQREVLKEQFGPNAAGIADSLKIDFDTIFVDHDSNVRNVFDADGQKSVADMLNTLKQGGQLKPMTVQFCELEQDGETVIRPVLADGHHTHETIRQAREFNKTASKQDIIKAANEKQVVLLFEGSDYDRKVLMIRSAGGRRLTRLQLCRQYSEMIHILGKTTKEIAETFNLSESNVKNTLILELATPEMVQMIERGDLKPTRAIELLREQKPDTRKKENKGKVGNYALAEEKALIEVNMYKAALEGANTEQPYTASQNTGKNEQQITIEGTTEANIAGGETTSEQGSNVTPEPEKQPKPKKVTRNALKPKKLTAKEQTSAESLLRTLAAKSSSGTNEDGSANISLSAEMAMELEKIAAKLEEIKSYNDGLPA